MRVLKIEELEMVSGGTLDEIIVTGTRTGNTGGDDVDFTGFFTDGYDSAAYDGDDTNYDDETGETDEESGILDEVAQLAATEIDNLSPEDTEKLIDRVSELTTYLEGITLADAVASGFSYDDIAKSLKALNALGLALSVGDIAMQLNSDGPSVPLLADALNIIATIGASTAAGALVPGVIPGAIAGFIAGTAVAFFGDEVIQFAIEQTILTGGLVGGLLLDITIEEIFDPIEDAVEDAVEVVTDDPEGFLSNFTGLPNINFDEDEEDEEYEEFLEQ